MKGGDGYYSGFRSRLPGLVLLKGPEPGKNVDGDVHPRYTATNCRKQDPISSVERFGKRRCVSLLYLTDRLGGIIDIPLKPAKVRSENATVSAAFSSPSILWEKCKASDDYPLARTSRVGAEMYFLS